MSTGLVIAGIDEAGYGPMLGPLCVGLAVFRVADWDPGKPAPDLWKKLAAAVCKSPADRRKRIAVEDSKKLKLPNDGKRHPLLHLERGVLSFLASAADAFLHDEHSLLDHLGVSPEPHPWYGPREDCWPRANDATALQLDANALRLSMGRAGIELLAVRCITVGETAFNAAIDRAGSKEEASAGAVAAHLRDVFERYGPECAAAGGPRIVCDRQSGRLCYENLLRRALGDAAVTIHEESPSRSRYTLAARTQSSSAPLPASILFQPEAESAFLPVALASMTAKYVRELMMARFNAYWRTLMPELKPTAGYVQDARRWLRDADGLLTPELRRTLVRRQ